MDAFETIKRRKSIRTYQDRPVEEEVLNRIKALMEEFREGPFGNQVRFELLDLGALDSQEMRRLGTYGIIKGARWYLLGAVKEGKDHKDHKDHMEDLGYSMERIILEITAMGLGTCWLGGTFRRGSFANQMNLSRDELLPAISPVGYPANENSFANRMVKLAAGSHGRKPWQELFFGPDGNTPLVKSQERKLARALEAVRLAPSAVNRQPWRVIKGSDGCCHFYLKENFFNLGKMSLQNLDMGIAMCHFHLVAQQDGLPGRWQKDAAAPQIKGLDYRATWVPA